MNTIFNYLFKFFKCMVLCLIVVISHEETALSQPCFPDIKPVADSALGYRMRENDKRCEGLYQKKVAGDEGFMLVGLIKGGFQFNMNEKEVLVISSPFIKNRPVYVSALPVYTTVYYRMDARIEPGKKFRWPIKDVIYPRRISRIGVFGWLNTETEKVYVPVCAVSETDPGVKNETITMMLRASVDVVQVKWEYADMINGERLSPMQKREMPPKKLFRIGTSVDIELPQTQTGELWVKVSASIRNSDYELVNDFRIMLKEIK